MLFCTLYIHISKIVTTIFILPQFGESLLNIFSEADKKSSRTLPHFFNFINKEFPKVQPDIS